MSLLVPLASLGPGVIQDADGNAQANRQINVFQPDTSAPVTVYTDATGASSLAQPLTTDSAGGLPGFVQPGQMVDLSDVALGRRIRVPVPVDPANLVSVSSPGAAQVPGVAPAVSVDDYLIPAANVAAGVQSAITAATNSGTTEGHVKFTPGKTYAYGAGSTPTIPANLPGRGVVIEWTGATLQPSASAPRCFDLATGSPGRTFNFELLGGTVDANWLGGLHHIVCGTYQNGSVTSGVDINLGRVVHRNLKVINALTDANTTVNHRRACLYYISASTTSPTVDDALFEDVSIEGGNCACEILGATAAVAINSVRHVRCHAKARAPVATGTLSAGVTLSGTPQTLTLSSSTASFASSGTAMASTVGTGTATSPVQINYTGKSGSTLTGCTGSGVLPTGAWVSQHGQNASFGPQVVWFPSAGFQTGSNATVAHATWEECTAKYYGDEGSEVNNQDFALFDRCVFEDNFKTNNFHENFQTPLNPDMQTLIYRNHTSRQVLNTVSTFQGNCFENSFTSSFPGGAIVWEGKCPTLDSTGRVYNFGQMVHIAGNVRMVDLDGLRCVMNGFNYAGSATVSHGIAQIGPSAVSSARPVVQFGRSTWKVAGQRTGTGSYSMDAILLNGNSAGVASVQPVFDINVTGVANGSNRCIEINGSGTTPTMTGGLSGGRVVNMAGDSAPRAIMVRGTSAVTLSGRFSIRGWDFSGMPSGGSEIFLVDNTNRAALVCSENTGCGSTVVDNATVASAATVTLPLGGEYFNITGTTQITTLTADYSGRRVSLIFTNATPGGIGNGNNLFLSAAFSPATDGIITLLCNGTNWFETSRSADR